MNITTDKVLEALGNVIDPDLKKDLVALGMIRDLQVEGKKVSFSLVLTTPACPLKDSLKSACTSAINDFVDPEAEVKVNLTSRVTAGRSKNEPILPGVKNIVAISSGKGGVGKSTVAANIAVSLAKSGARVGLLDADIYGPSIPLMFDSQGVELTAIDVGGGRLMAIPFERYGVFLASIGFFVDASRALVWRGPMAANFLKQMITDVQWGELDYMLIDLPPGTGDIHLTMVQTIPLTGAIVVTTPQQIATADARKGIDMFMNSNINVPVLGVVENMSWFTPAELPQNRYYLFGKGGGQKLADQAGVPFLGQIPIIQSVMEGVDGGKPEILNPHSLSKPYFDSLASELARQVSIRNAKKQGEKVP